MNSDSMEDDAKSEALGRFLEELETTADAPGLIRQYSAEHPQWSADFAEEAALTRLLVTSRDGIGLPNLERLSDFHVVRWLATGGMGIVYEAEQISLGRRVALKVRHGRPSGERQVRFQREQLALARLHQSHIVPIHVSGECDGWQYFAMAFIEGASLHRLVKAALDHLRTTSAPMPTLPALVERVLARPANIALASAITRWTASATNLAGSPNAAARDLAASHRPLALSDAYFRSVAQLVADAADALEFAHNAGVVHRDIKPSNIMVDKAGHCWLIDFGLAQCTGVNESESGESPLGVAAPGRTMGPMGTPEYMAPEQHQPSPEGIPADHRCDVWGLGATLYELLTLRSPFCGSTYPEIKQKVLTEEPAPIESLVRTIPADVAAICRKAMHKDATGRYARAAELAADLRRWLNGEPTTARPARWIRSAWMWAARNRGWAVGLTSIVFLCAAVGFSIILHTQSETRQADFRASAAEDQRRAEVRNSQLQRRESLIQQVERLRSSRTNHGWSDEAWDLVRQASEIERDDRLRDLAAATLLGLDARIIKRFPVPGSSVAFAPDGKRLLVGGIERSPPNADRPAWLWASDLDQQWPSALPGEGLVGFDSEANPLQLVFQNDREMLVLWDLLRGKAVREFPLAKMEAAPDAPEPVLAVSGRVEQVAASAGKQTVVWHVRSKAVLARFDFKVDAMSFSAEGHFLAMAEAGQQQIVIWSLNQKKILAKLSTGTVPVTSLAFGKAAHVSDSTTSGIPGEYLAVGDAGGNITIWDLKSHRPINFCRGSPRSISTLAFSPDGTLLASGGREEARLWDVASGQLVMRLRDSLGMDFLTGVAFSPDGNRVAVTSRGIFYAPSVSVWELTRGRGLRRLAGLSGQIEMVAISSDSKRVAALSQNWNIGVWDLQTGQLRAIFEAPHGAHADNAALAFSPDGRRLAYSVGATHTGEARLWDLETYKETGHWKLPPGLQNKIIFDRQNRLWHFQVEIQSGRAIPDSAFPWRQHPRVARIRKLTDADPQHIVAEVADFNCHIYLTQAAPDGEHVVVEGKGGPKGEQRWVKIIELATGKPTWTHRIQRANLSGDIFLEPSGKAFYFTDTDSLPMLGVTVPDGKPCGELPWRPYAIADGAEYAGIIHNGAKRRCAIVRKGETRPVVSLLPDTDLGALAFDRSSRRMIWGSTDGSVTVCDIPDIRTRLNRLGLGW